MAIDNLPDIEFAERDAATIEASVITAFEAISGDTLFPGDPRRLFLEAVASLIAQQRSVIDFAAKMNLLSYAQGDYLDVLGELVLGPDNGRRDPQPALTTIQFTLSAAQPGVVTIPAGTEVSGGSLAFATQEALEIPAGDLTGSVTAECSQAGTIGNGLLPGQIRTIVEPIPFVASATNTTATDGGADTENDENLRERIRLAPSSFSVAGPRDAYIFWARTANQAIIDVSVLSPTPDDIKQLVYTVLADNNADPALVTAMETELDNADWPGTVRVRPLLDGGDIPTQDVLDQVDDVLTATNVRPLTDEVIVQAPTDVSYAITVDYWISSTLVSQAATIQAAVTAAVEGYRVWQRSAIGRDINPDELTQRMKQAGAKRVVITSPVFTVLDETEVAQESAVTVNYQGLEDA